MPITTLPPLFSGRYTVAGCTTGSPGPLTVTQCHIIPVYGLYPVEASSTVDVVEAGGVAGVDEVISRTSIYLISALTGGDPIGAFSPVDNWFCVKPSPEVGQGMPTYSQP